MVDILIIVPGGEEDIFGLFRLGYATIETLIRKSGFP